MRTKTDDELIAIGDNMVGTLDWHQDETKHLTREDWDFLYTVVEECDGCGYYQYFGEVDRNGHCEDCEQTYKEDEDDE